MFEWFYCVDLLWVCVSGGIGLGLLIVDFLVVVYGGVVIVMIVFGEGCCFCVLLLCVSDVD